MASGPMYEGFAADGAYNALYGRPAVLRLAGDVRGRTVLDAGCGPGLYAEERVGDQADLRVHDLSEPLYFVGDGSVDLVVLALTLYFTSEPVEGSLDPNRDWHVRAWRRPLTEVCREFRAAGFLIEELVEPRPVTEMAERFPADHARLEHSPAFIAFRLVPG